MLVILAFAAIYVLWGSTYLAIRYTVDTLPPFLTAGVRAFVAGLILSGIVGITRMRRLTAQHWRSATIAGGLLFLGCHGLLFWTEKTVDSGVAALMLATIPGWIVVLSRLAGQSALTARTLVGLVLGLVAVALLVVPSEQNARAACSPVSACVLLASAMLWALGSLYGRSAHLPQHTGTATAMQLLCGGALAILAGLLFGEGSLVAPARVGTRALLSLCYLVIFGSLISFAAYTWLLRVAEPATVGTYAYVNPVVAVLLGWLLGGESLDYSSVAAVAVIVVSVALVHHDQSRAGSRRTERAEAAFNIPGRQR